MSFNDQNIGLSLCEYGLKSRKLVLSPVILQDIPMNLQGFGFASIIVLARMAICGSGMNSLKAQSKIVQP